MKRCLGGIPYCIGIIPIRSCAWEIRSIAIPIGPDRMPEARKPSSTMPFPSAAMAMWRHGRCRSPSRKARGFSKAGAAHSPAGPWEGAIRSSSTAIEVMSPRSVHLKSPSVGTTLALASTFQPEHGVGKNVGVKLYIFQKNVILQVVRRTNWRGREIFNTDEGASSPARHSPASSTAKRSRLARMARVPGGRICSSNARGVRSNTRGSSAGTRDCSDETSDLYTIGDIRNLRDEERPVIDC